MTTLLVKHAVTTDQSEFENILLKCRNPWMVDFPTLTGKEIYMNWCSVAMPLVGFLESKGKRRLLLLRKLLFKSKSMFERQPATLLCMLWFVGDKDLGNVEGAKAILGIGRKIVGWNRFILAIASDPQPINTPGIERIRVGAQTVFDVLIPCES